MERLTEWIEDGEHRQAIPKTDIRSNGHNRCCNKLADYEDLEEQGLLVKLPDDLFKKVYRITYEYTECSKFGETVIDCENYNCNCDCDSEKKFYIVENNLQFMLFCNYYNELDKTVFLTREEAEKKLEEMKK
jgi:hypothetical protein